MSQLLAGHDSYGEAMTAAAPSIVWLRDDLRVADNPALQAAIERGAPIVAVFVLDDDPRVARPRGAASRWWLHNSLDSLIARLDSLGARLVLRRGRADEELRAVVAASGAEAVFWNRRYGQGERDQDAGLKQRLRSEGVTARSFNGSLLFEPWTVMKADGSPYGVFSAYWRACLAGPSPRTPLGTPTELHGWEGNIPSDSLASWHLLPTAPDWAEGLREAWTPGETGAHARLEEFLAEQLDDYPAGRERPGLDGSSRLSPHLRFGEISPHQVWQSVTRAGALPEAAERYLSEIGWREFNYNLLFHNPDMAGVNLRPEFDRFPWNTADDTVIGRWRHGDTGFPLVDAGMRQLWHTGWMHNRVRMVTASFLIKNLLIDWRVGERWFWDTLVDADPANNTANWQWVAGSGVDSSPFFRVFNPVTQSRKFDPDGGYLRRWIPELRDLDASAIHEPWNTLGADGYSAPMVDLRESRAEALAAFDEIKQR